MNRGDVVRIQLPRPRGTPGHEQFGMRPAIIVQDEPSLANLSTVLIVPMTSNRAATRFTGSILVSPSKSNGLTMPSVALTQQLRAVDKTRIDCTLGSVSSDVLEAIDDALRQMLKI